MPRGAFSLRSIQSLIPDEGAARRWFERSRWTHGPECPGCGLVGKAWWVPSREVWCCQGCRRQFTVKAGTPLHKSVLPLLVWAQAIYLIVASSKGISARKLSEMLGVSYSAAWFLGHRIRSMMQQAHLVLSGVVEIDETYAGGPPRKAAAGSTPTRHPTGRGTLRPQVLVAAQRGGAVFAQVIESHSRMAIARALDSRLAPDAVLVTDGLPAYAHLGDRHRHLTVTHSRLEYARTDADTGLRVHVNRVESFNAFLQRAVSGVWHWICRKHLDRYTGETAFRWNHRRQSVVSRMAGLLATGADPLSYAALTAA